MDERIAIALKSDKISDIPLETLVTKVKTMLSSVYMLTGFYSQSKGFRGIGGESDLGFETISRRLVGK